MASMENGKKEKPSYYSVIPAEVRYCAALGKPTARDLYGEIAALCNKHGYCFAANGYLAALYGIGDRTIRRYLALLEKEGFIYVKAGKQRRIYLAHASKFNPKGLREPIEDEEPRETAEPAKMKKEEKKPKFTDEDLYLAEMLRSKILLNFPDLASEKVAINAWADEMRKLRTLDNKGERLVPEKEVTGYQIEFVITWVHGGTIQPLNSNKRPFVFAPNDFWPKNILSASKFRKQWYKLVAAMQQDLKKEVKKHGVTDMAKPSAPQHTTQTITQM